MTRIIHTGVKAWRIDAATEYWSTLPEHMQKDQGFVFDDEHDRAFRIRDTLVFVLTLPIEEKQLRIIGVVWMTSYSWCLIRISRAILHREHAVGQN